MSLHSLHEAFPGSERLRPGRRQVDAIAAGILRKLHSAEAPELIHGALRVLRNAGGASPWERLTADHAEVIDWADWLGILQPIVQGARTGHRWAVCGTCGRGILRSHPSPEVACKMTPRCEGKHAAV